MLNGCSSLLLFAYAACNACEFPLSLQSCFSLQFLITVELNTDNIVLNDDEFWIEVEAPTNANAAYRQWDRDSKMTPLGTPAAAARGISSRRW